MGVILLIIAICLCCKFCCNSKKSKKKDVKIDLQPNETLYENELLEDKDNTNG